MKDFRQFAIKQNLRLRALLIQAVRSLFIEKDYLEVETPCRIPAPAPETHIDAVTSASWFLQTSQASGNALGIDDALCRFIRD